MGIRIASFNMHNISPKADRDLDRIAAIILGKRNHLSNGIEDNKPFDIVAMQEVLSEGRAITGHMVKNVIAHRTALEKSLIWRLGKNWDAFWMSPRTHAKDENEYDKRGEGYLFLWNTQKFELLKDKDGNIIEPTIFQHYKTAPGMPRLIRDPLYGRFKIKHTKSELRLITTHIISGKPANPLIPDVGTLILRRNEFNILAGSIYKRISDYRKDINTTVPCTVILGDYNLNLASSDANNYKFDFPGEVACFDSKGYRVPINSPNSTCIYTIQSEKTSLGDGHYANNFDHFSFDDDTRKIVVRCNQLDAVHSHEKPEDQTEEQKFARFKKEVSDHVPIILDIDLRKR
mgnify:CR=1 FL=1